MIQPYTPKGLRGVSLCLPLIPFKRRMKWRIRQLDEVRVVAEQAPVGMCERSTTRRRIVRRGWRDLVEAKMGNEAGWEHHR